MRSASSVLALVLVASLFAFAACSEGVTPVCTPDAGCGPKAPTDAATRAETPAIP